jgi:Pyridoxamine 5'-phosphate oxidase
LPVPAPAPAALAADQAQWIQGPLSISVGTCGELGRPHVTRAVGCCVDGDRSVISILLQASTATHSLDDLRRNGRVGVVFCDPATNRSLQIKGHAQRITPAGAGGHELAQLWVRGFGRSVASRAGGYLAADTVVRAMLTTVEDDLVLVTIALNTVFDQTPGPAAGCAVATVEG